MPRVWRLRTSNTMSFVLGSCHKVQPQRRSSSTCLNGWGYGIIVIENEEDTCSFKFSISKYFHILSMFV